MSIVAIAFKTIVSAFTTLLPKVRQLLGERATGQASDSVPLDHTDEILNEALGRMASADFDQAWWKQLLEATGGAFVRPEWIKKPHVQDWLKQPDVRKGLKAVARSRLNNNPAPHPEYEALVLSYMNSSLEDRQHAESMINVATAILKSSVLFAVRDPGTAALIQNAALESRNLIVDLTDKFDAYAKPFAITDVGELTPGEVSTDAWRTELTRVSTDLLAWPTTLENNEWINRPEFDQLVTIIDTSDSSTTALLGLPGSGKSALMAVLGKHFQTRNTACVLAIKADILDTEVRTEADLQMSLDLPEKPSVMLQRLALDGPVILLIDQLDALASYLDMRTGRLSALLNLVRRVGKRKNVHIILSSRTFEFNHDLRLKSIEAASLGLELPPWPEVENLLSSYGVKASGWPPDAKEVMRSPQALSIFLTLKEDEQSEPFSTYQGMLDALWNERVLNGAAGARNGDLVSRIANLMGEEECLWIARARFDSDVEGIKALLSAGILTTYGNESSVGFTHQTLFEYALARNFAQGAGRLSTYVVDRQESLFVRPKLWAALNYLRDAEPSRYAIEFAAIWSTAGLAKHLKILLIDFLGQQKAPTDQEELFLVQSLKMPEEQPFALKAIAGSAGWLSRLSEIHIPIAMSNDGALPDLIVNILAQAWPHSPELVLHLLEQNWVKSKSNDQRTWFVLQDAFSWSEKAFSIAAIIVGRTEFSPHQIDAAVAMLGVSQPEMALRLVRTYLDAMLQTALSQVTEAETAFGASDESDSISQKISRHPKKIIKDLIQANLPLDSLITIAEAEPFSFLEIMWGWYIHVLENLNKFSAEGAPDLGFPLAHSLDFRIEEETSLELPPPSIIDALLTSIRQAVKKDEARFLLWIRQALDIELAPVQRLIAHGMSRGSPHIAIDALEFLMGDTRRFHLGSFEDLQSTSRALVHACAPHWTPSDVQRFELSVTAYRPNAPSRLTDPSQRRSWLRMVRRIQVDLLRALPSRNMSPAVKRRVQEDSRVFPVKKTRTVEGGIIDSIMAIEDFDRASDEDIIKAFIALPDATNWDHPKIMMKGGNIQLSRVFASFAKENQPRALRLISKFAPGSGERAAGYAIDEIASTAEPSSVTSLILELSLRGFVSEEFRSSAARAIERLIERKVAISDETVALLVDWLPMPASEQPASESNCEDEVPLEEEKAHDDESPRESLLFGHGGITLVPGGTYSILDALIRVRLARGESEAIMEMLTGYLKHTNDSKIWECILRYLIYLRAGEVDLRPQFIQSLLAGLPQLVGTRASAILLTEVLRYAPEIVQAELERWNSSPRREARQGYGELTTLAAIVRPELEWPQRYLNELLEEESVVDGRAGAALVAVHLWIEPKHRAHATAILVRLCVKTERGVWTAIFDLFRLVDELHNEDHTIQLLTAIADNIHTAPALSGTFVVERLGTLLPHEAVLVAKIADGLVKLWRTRLTDVRTSEALVAPQLFDLATTLHRLGPDTRKIGLNLFESLLEIDAYQSREMLNEIDNRFKGAASAARPRLRRRPKGRSRSRQVQ
jgi:hypothetical protein